MQNQRASLTQKAGPTSFLLDTILVILVIALNLQSLNIGFLTDDFWLMDEVANRGVHLFGRWIEGLSYYRPVVMSTLWLNYRFNGVNPIGYHVFNLALHSINVLLLFHLMRMIYRSVTKSDNSSKGILLPSVLTLLFIIHPANAHDVAWISGRTDLLCGLFVILMLIAFLRFEALAKPFWRIVSYLFFLIALATKEFAIVAPFVALGLSVETSLLAFKPSAPRDSFTKIIRMSFVRTSGLFVLDAFYVLMRLLMFQLSAPIVNFANVGIGEVPIFALKSMFFFVSPINPMVAFSLCLHDPLIIIAIVVVIAVWTFVALSPFLSKLDRQLLLSILVLLFTTAACFLPYIYIEMIAQRLMYVPFICFAVLLVPIITSMGQRGASNTLASVAGILLLLAVSTIYLIFYQQNINRWQEAGRFEAKLTHDVASQVDDPNRPIVLLDFPSRVDQAPVLYFTAYRLYYAFYGRFGKCDSVFSGFCVVAYNFKDAGNGIRLVPLNNMYTEFTLSSDTDMQYFYPDPFGVKFDNDNSLIADSENKEKFNSLFEMKPLQENAAKRATQLMAKAIHPELLVHAQIFTYEDGSMHRVR